MGCTLPSASRVVQKVVLLTPADAISVTKQQAAYCTRIRADRRRRL